MLDYSRRSANPVGRLVLRIAGYDEPRLDAWSDAICSALQLTNFWQDLKIDFDRGRIYLPAEEIRGHGADEGDLAAGRLTRAWRAAMAAAVARTRALFLAGRPLCGAVAGRLKHELRATWLGGMRVLSRIERVDFDVVARRPSLRRRRRSRGWRGSSRPGRSSPSDGSRDTSFYYSFLVLPPRKRHAILAVWDFCRAVDDAVDEVIPEDEWKGGLTPRGARPRRRIAGRLARRAGAHLRRHPADAAGQVAAAVGVGVQPAEAASSRRSSTASRWTCRIAKYPDFEALSSYCHKVASSVGLICVEIFGYRDPGARDYAVNLGMALQLTNIIRDVAADLKRGPHLPADGRSGVVPRHASTICGPAS